VERYPEGEVIEPAGGCRGRCATSPRGQVSLRQPVPTGNVALLTLNDGDYLGQAALTWTPQDQVSIALTEVETLVIPHDVLDELAPADHQLAREFGRQLDRRRTTIDDALAELAPATGAILSSAQR